MRSINSDDLFTFYISSECNIGQLLLFLHFFFHFGNDMNRESEIMSLLQMKSAIPCLRKGLRAVEAFVADIHVYCLHMLDQGGFPRVIIPTNRANKANLRTMRYERVSVLYFACKGEETAVDDLSAKNLANCIFMQIASEFRLWFGLDSPRFL